MIFNAVVFATDLYHRIHRHNKLHNKLIKLLGKLFCILLVWKLYSVTSTVPGISLTLTGSLLENKLVGHSNFQV